jgi:hypothetical protein
MSIEPTTNINTEPSKTNITIIKTNIDIPYNFLKSIQTLQQTGQLKQPEETEQICNNMVNKFSNDLLENSKMNEETTPKININGGKYKNRKSKRKRHKTIKNKKNKTKSKNQRKNKKTKKIYNQTGGTKLFIFYFIIIIFLMFNPLSSDALTPTKDKDVLSRIVSAGKNSLVFDNSKGTCASNVLFFLKTISLETHVNNLLNGVIMNTNNISQNLNINATLETKWLDFSLFSTTNSEIQENMDSNELIDYRAKLYVTQLQKYCSSIGKGFITIFIYPGKREKHATILWYTETGNIVLIDPQLFSVYKNYGIEIYSDINNESDKYNAGSGITVYSLTNYIRKNVKLESTFELSWLLTSKHFQLNNNSTELSESNPYYEKGIKLLKENENKKDSNSDL